MTVRLAGIFAHPDDDAYLIGGTLLLHAGEIDLTILFATSGGAGPISDPSTATRETLGAVREGEQRAYLDIIGYDDARVEFLRHPDYYLPDVPLEQLIDEIAGLLTETRPHVVVTFGPDGLTSHHDHIRVGAAATEAFHRVRSESGAPDDGTFQRLYYAVLRRTDVDRFYAGVRDGAYRYGEEGALFDITGVADEEVGVRVGIDALRERKLEGMLAHRTQLIEWERIPEPLRWIYLDAEHFQQAWPHRDPGGPVRGDLLEDLTAGAPGAHRSG